MWKTPEVPDPPLRREPPHQHPTVVPAVVVTQEERLQQRGGTTTAMMAMPTSTAVAAVEGNGEYAREIAESLRFQEEIQSLMREGLLEAHMVPGGASSVGVPPSHPPSSSSSSPSFTALLGLPPNQAMELLHDPVVPHPAASSCATLPLTAADFPFPGISPTFPSNAALVERAARYSVFATAAAAAAAANAEGSTESSSLQPSNSSGSARAVKPEPADSDSRSEQMQQQQLASSLPQLQQQRGGKRKEPEKNKGKSGSSGKKSKSGTAAGGGEDGAEAEEKQPLPYVHVRARRGQATDSHSLAERARREKINARMKLLQELVPGCSKISGTALVLDEIINHVQCLQRQVEMLSMRLAAVNPRIDFGGIDSFVAADPVRLPGSAVGMDAAATAAPPLWAEVPVDGVGRRNHHHNHQQNQIWQGDSAGPQPQPQPSPSLWSGDSGHQQQQLFLHHHHHHQQHFPHHGLIGPGTSLFGYDSASAVPLHANQLKTEL